MSGEIQDLFDKDPMKYSKQDLDTIIAYMRKAREEFRTGDKRAGTEPRKKKNKGAGIDVDI